MHGSFILIIKQINLILVLLTEFLKMTNTVILQVEQKI